MAHIWLDDHGRDIVSIPWDGLSFVHCVQYSLAAVYNKIYSTAEIKEKILSEIRRKITFYRGSLQGVADAEGVVENIETYFDTHFYSTDIFDLLVMVTLNVFRITIWVFQEDEKKMLQSIRYVMEDEISQRRHIHMMLYNQKDDIMGLGNHYNSVVRKKYNNGEGYIDFGQQVENVDSAEKTSNLSSLERKRQQNRSSASTSSSTSGPSLEGNFPTPQNVPILFEHEDQDKVEHHFSADPDASEFNATSESQHVIFPEEIFEDIQPENVRCEPYNINGNHCYTINVPSKKWHKYQDDGRWFAMHTSTMRKLRMTRKIGKCLGSFVCRNDQCPKYTSGKGQNTYAFTSIGLNLFECKTCGHVAERDFCGALKLMKFHPETNILKVFYAGTHTCNLKVRTPYSNMSKKTKKDVLRPILQKNPKATVKEISEQAAESFICLGNADMVKEAVQMAQDKRFVAEMREEVLKLVCDKDPNSFKAIGELRESLKDYYPFFIYKINDGSFNDEVSYIFKSSTCAAELAIEMYCDDPENRSCLRDEPVCCDTMHSRVDHYKNVTAWFKNPITQLMMCIATMEIKREDTHTLQLFFNLLNEILQKFLVNHSTSSTHSDST